MSETNVWRNKYLQALEASEQLEQNASQQQALLRRALLRLSVTADGQDEELDRVLKGLRDTLRSKVTFNQLERYMLVVEDAVSEFENCRSSRTRAICSAMRALCDQLQKLDIPVDTQHRLKQFKRELKSKTGHFQQLPTSLNELSSLQACILQQQGHNPQGFWERLLSQLNLSRRHRNSAPGLNPDTAPEPEPEPEPEPAICGSETDGEAQCDFQEAGEPAFSNISAKVTQVLMELLENVEPVACVEEKATDTRQRIGRGLNWYELVPALEDIRDLVIQAHLTSDRKFEEYLATVNTELETVCQRLGGTINAEADMRRATENLQASLGGQMQTLQTSLTTATDIESLKSQVNTHIDSIQTALERFQLSQNSTDAPLEQQLQALVSRVECMEAQAQQHKIDIEKQRRKALQDPLTQLPNRQAYSERVFMEYQRWKRYRHPLTLAICDIDFFKKINDSYGHQAGDRVLIVLSRAIFRRLRKVDFIARYGGEEFVLLLPETNGEVSLQILDKIRETIAITPFRFKNKPVQVTISVGLAVFSGEETIENVFARADEKLYEAKNQGRNRCLLG